MRGYIIKRLLLTIPTLFVVTIVSFFLIRIIPGDIIDLMAQELAETIEEGGGYNIEIDRASIERSLGLDVPIFQQYGRWLGFVRDKDGNFSGIFQGNFGRSLWTNRPVMEMLAPRWPLSVQLSLMALIISQVVAIPIGIYSALRQDTVSDYTLRSFALFALTVPNFWLATLFIVFSAIYFGYSAPAKYIPFSQDPIGNFKLLIVPALIMGLSGAGGTMRIMRTMMLEVLRQDYIRTAWAKGLRERTVVIRHAFRNALIPIIGVIGNLVRLLIGGTFIIETIFRLPGMGRLGITALRGRDYTVFISILLLSSITVVVGNLVVDISYAFVDPRISYRKF